MTSLRSKFIRSQSDNKIYCSARLYGPCKEANLSSFKRKIDKFIVSSNKISNTDKECDYLTRGQSVEDKKQGTSNTSPSTRTSFKGNSRTFNCSDETASIDGDVNSLDKSEKSHPLPGHTDTKSKLNRNTERSFQHNDQINIGVKSINIPLRDDSSQEELENKNRPFSILQKGDDDLYLLDVHEDEVANLPNPSPYSSSNSSNNNNINNNSSNNNNSNNKNDNITNGNSRNSSSSDNRTGLGKFKRSVYRLIQDNRSETGSMKSRMSKLKRSISCSENGEDSTSFFSLVSNAAYQQSSNDGEQEEDSHQPLYFNAFSTSEWYPNSTHHLGYNLNRAYSVESFMMSRDCQECVRSVANSRRSSSCGDDVNQGNQDCPSVTDRMQMRRGALAEPEKMLISQDLRERTQRDNEKRKASVMRKFSQFFNVHLRLNLEEDLI